MSGRQAKARRRFLADQQAAVVADHARLLALPISRGQGVVEPDGHPATDRFEERLRLWTRARLVKRCPHLAPATAPAKAYWFPRQPELIRCEACADPVIERRGSEIGRCDHCDRPGRQLTGILTLVETVMIVADICADCDARGGDAS